MDDSHGLKTLHCELLEILDDIDRVCRRNDIKYSLYAGTLIGAMRHQGSIPWDDDADVVFERTEFDRFLRVYRQEKRQEYSLEWVQWVPRVVKELPGTGVQRTRRFVVDVFVMDSVPDGLAARGLKLLMVRALQGMLKDEIEWSQHGLVGKILSVATYALGRCFSKDRKLALYDKVSRWGDQSHTAFVSVYNGSFHDVGRLFPREVVSGYIDVEFEGRTFMSMCGYNSCLTALYGDYMTPPPASQRQPVHNW